MEILVGSDTGVIKKINLTNTNVSLTFGSSQKDNPVLFLDWLKYKDGFMVCLKRKSLTILRISEGNTENMDNIDYEVNAISMHMSKQQKKIFIIFETGKILQYSIRKMKFSLINELNAAVSLQKDCFISRTRINSPGFEKIAFLFRGMNPQVFDISESKFTWKARNVKNDFLDLKVPIYDTDCEFYDKANFLITCTAYHKIRVYDLLKQNSQPILDIESSENSPFNIMRVFSKFLYVANHNGSILKWKINHTDSSFGLNIAGKFNCSRATLKTLEIVKEEQEDEILIVASGYDRYMTITEESSKSLKKRIFTGMRVNSMHVPKHIICPETEENEKEEEKLVEKYKEANQSKSLNLGLYPRNEISDWQSESSLNSKKVKTS